MSNPLSAVSQFKESGDLYSAIFDFLQPLRASIALGNKISLGIDRLWVGG